VFEDWGVDRAVAVNLARHAREHEPAVLEAAIRHGVGHDGRALWSMPSYNFVHLADADVAAIIAYLRSAPVVEHDLPAARLGWRTRWSIVTEADGDMPAWVAQVPALVVGPDEPDAVRRGERLAMTSCNECHGLDLRGSTMEPDSRPPDLAIVAGYPWKAFQRLMREGIPLDGRDLGLMAMVAKDRFADWTPGEVADLYAFLQTLPRRPVPTGVFWRPGA
jgi:mono/diheme cytochrome c family protein